MNFFDSLKAFGEGAWESVTDGAQQALGNWVGGASGDATPEGAQAVTGAASETSGQDANSTGNSTTVLFGLNKKELAVGGGVLLFALILVAKL